MKGFDKIEDKINELIMVAVNAIKSIFAPYLPKKAITKVKSKKENLIKKKESGKEKLKLIVSSLLTRLSSLKDSLQGFVQKIKEIDFKSIKLRQVAIALAAFITPAGAKIKTWYLSIKPQTIVLTIAGSAVVTLTSLNIYVESQKMTRDPASAQEAELVEELKRANALSKRETYHKKLEKQFRIEGVILPVYLDDKKFVQRIDLDLTVDASNKYIRAYFNENHYYVRDMLNTQISPIDVNFPLKEEGKIVIKDKVKKELNQLLKKLNIKGEILEVNISSVFGG